MRKYGWLLAIALLVGCSDFGPTEYPGFGAISGTITVVPGDERINAGISIRNADGDVMLGQTVNGGYVVRLLVVGSYTVSVDPPNGYELAPGTLNNVPVSIEADETEMVNFQLRVIQ
jgi:hypothetical protein